MIMNSNEKLYTCQYCHGYGGEVDVILDYGEGPFVECWVCDGKGEVTGKQRSIYLHVMKEMKKEKMENELSR